MAGKVFSDSDYTWQEPVQCHQFSNVIDLPERPSSAPSSGRVCGSSHLLAQEPSFSSCKPRPQKQRAGRAIPQPASSELTVVWVISPSTRARYSPGPPSLSDVVPPLPVPPWTHAPNSVMGPNKPLAGIREDEHPLWQASGLIPRPLMLI